MDWLDNLITQFWEYLRQFISSIFQAIFGDINFAVLWNWLPQDIQNASAFFVILLFSLMLWKLIKSLLPI